MDGEAGEAAWRAAVAKVLRGGNVSDLVTWTRDGLAVEPLHAAAGSSPQPFRSQARWRIAQRVDHPEPEAAHALARIDVAGGADTLILVAAGAPSARGFGLACDDQAGLDSVLDGIDLGAVAMRLDPGPEALADALRLGDVLGRRHPATAGLDIDFGVDPVGAGVAGTASPPLSSGLAAALTGLHAALRAKGFTTPILRADGRIWHEAGASEAQELAAVLATGVLYWRVLEAGGIPLDVVQKSVSFVLVADTDQLLTIAKFRSLRRLWARLEAACGLEPRPIWLHGETAWRSLARIDPATNLLRGASAAFAGAVGGADGLTVLPFTAALGLPDDFARRLARNTQIILAEEGQLWRVADPAAGAGAFEALTEALTLQAWALFQDIEGEGGLLASLAAGRWPARLEACRQARLADVAAAREILVGVNRFPPDTPGEAAVLRPRPAAADRGGAAGRRLADIFETAAGAAP